MSKRSVAVKVAEVDAPHQFDGYRYLGEARRRKYLVRPQPNRRLIAIEALRRQRGTPAERLKDAIERLWQRVGDISGCCRVPRPSGYSFVCGSGRRAPA